MYAFQEQTSDDTTVMLKGFSTVINALGVRAKPYLPQICGMTCETEQQISQSSNASCRSHLGYRRRMMACEETFWDICNAVQYLGEEYPEVLIFQVASRHSNDRYEHATSDSGSASSDPHIEE